MWLEANFTLIMISWHALCHNGFVLFTIQWGCGARRIAARGGSDRTGSLGREAVGSGAWCTEFACGLRTVDV